MKFISYRKEIINVKQLKEVKKKDEKIYILYGDERTGYGYVVMHDPKDLAWDDLKIFLNEGKGVFDLLEYEVQSLCDFIYRNDEPKKSKCDLSSTDNQ